MAASSTPSNAALMLRELREADDLAPRLTGTAPRACAAEGGAAAIVAAYGGPTGAGFWSLRLHLVGEPGITLWERMADEASLSARGRAED